MSPRRTYAAAFAGGSLLSATWIGLRCVLWPYRVHRRA